MLFVEKTHKRRWIFWRFMPNKAAEPVFKLIQSAVANAEQNYGLDAEELYVHRIYADDDHGIGYARMVVAVCGRGRFTKADDASFFAHYRCVGGT